MESDNTALIWIRGLFGAALGAVVGAWVFGVLLRQGFYAAVAPGALLGIGCGIASGGVSRALGVLCGGAGLLLGVYCEWREMPFLDDGSFLFFVQNLGELPGLKQIMLALGGFCGYWFGVGRQPTIARPKPRDPSQGE